jgi:hypothetical protein
MKGALSSVPDTPRRRLARFAHAGMPGGGRLPAAGHPDAGRIDPAFAPVTDRVPEKRPGCPPDRNIVLMQGKGGGRSGWTPKRSAHPRPVRDHGPANTRHPGATRASARRGLWPPARGRHTRRRTGAMAPARPHGTCGRLCCFVGQPPMRLAPFSSLSTPAAHVRIGCDGAR